LFDKKRTKSKINMKWLTLEKIKAQLRIEPDFTAEDTLLESYGESAETTLLNYLNRQYADILGSYGDVPLPLVQASLMLVDTSYQHRSPISVTNISLVPYTFDLLVKPYMRLTSAEGEGDVQTVTLGSDVKIEFTADLPDELLLKDIDFTVKVINADTNNQEDYTKADCIMVGDGADYVVLVDTEDMGIGTLMLRLTVFIPDTDYQSGTRKEVIKIDPHVRVVG
jgi:hypothetical protein